MTKPAASIDLELDGSAFTAETTRDENKREVDEEETRGQVEETEEVEEAKATTIDATVAANDLSPTITGMTAKAEGGATSAASKTQIGDEIKTAEMIEEVLHTVAKDPLDIGVPMPVIVRRRRMPPATAMTTKLESSASRTESETGTESADPCTIYATEMKDNNGCEEEVVPATDVTTPIDSEKRGSRDQTMVADAAVAAAAEDAGGDEGDGGADSSMTRDRPSASSRPPSLPGGYAVLSPMENPPSLRRSRDNDEFMTSIPSIPGGFAVGGPDSEFGSGAMFTEENISSGEFSAVDPVDLTRESTHATLLTATLVGDDEDSNLNTVERQEGILIHAEAKPLESSRRSTVALVVGFLIICAGLIVAIVFATEDQQEGGNMMLSMEGNSSIAGLEDDQPRVPTLQLVRERGYVRCGAVQLLAAFLGEVHEINVKNNYTSLEDIVGVPSLKSRIVRNMCSAIAAAALGNKSAFEVIRPPEEDKYVMLANGSVDVLMTRRSVTMEQDIFEKDGAGEGLSHGIPYLYGGLGFTGDPAYVNCADDNIKTFGNCSDLRICINQESFFLKELELRVPSRQLVVENLWMPLLDAFKAGECNAIATESAVLISACLRATGFNGKLLVGKREYSSEFWGMKTIDSDPQWHNFLDATVMALLAANQANVTKEDAYRMGKTDIFGKEFEDMFINAVGAGGNYGQIYSFPMPRDGRNQVNDGTTGLLASPPLGLVTEPYVDHDYGPVPGGTLEAVIKRGFLRCGVRGGRPGFATYNSSTSIWDGMDVEYCRALATALFNGDADSIIFEDISHLNLDGQYALLDDGTVDVAAGAVWTLQKKMQGFSFTQPYFYAPVPYFKGRPDSDGAFEENLCLVTKQTDTQWSSFVFWAAQSLVYAEEQGMSQEDSFDLPLIYCFGLDLVRMFRDIIHQSGNYGQVYERHLGTILPRGGRNTLNLKESFGPLVYIPPGFEVLEPKPES